MSADRGLSAASRSWSVLCCECIPSSADRGLSAADHVSSADYVSAASVYRGLSAADRVVCPLIVV